METYVTFLLYGNFFTDMKAFCDMEIYIPDMKAFCDVEMHITDMTWRLFCDMETYITDMEANMRCFAESSTVTVTLTPLLHRVLRDLAISRQLFWIKSISNGFNSLGPSDAIWRWISWSTLVQVMACCLTAPSHYLNQCWLIINKVLWHSSWGYYYKKIWRYQSVNQDGRLHFQNHIKISQGPMS